MELLNCVTTKKENHWCLHESPETPEFAYVLRITDPHQWQSYSSHWVCLRDRGTKGRREEFSFLSFCSRYSHILCFEQWFPTLSLPHMAVLERCATVSSECMWSTPFRKVPWVHSGLHKASRPLVSYTTGLICHGSMGVIITGTWFWNHTLICLFNLSFVYIYIRLSIFQGYSHGQTQNSLMPWSHTTSFLHLTTPAVQLSFWFHSSATSYWTKDMLWLGHLLILLSESPSVLLTSKKGKFKPLSPNDTLHFLIFCFL